MSWRIPPDVNSGGTLRNVPPLLSHRSLYAVSFDGYLISLTACAQPKAQTVSKYQLAAPQYPQMAQYPDETKFSRPNGDFDSDGFNQVYDAWQADRRKQMEQPEGYTDVLDGYLRAVIPQLLTGGSDELQSN